MTVNSIMTDAKDSFAIIELLVCISIVACYNKNDMISTEGKGKLSNYDTFEQGKGRTASLVET